MLDAIEIAVFHLTVFGGCYAAGGAIADLLDRLGIWPMEEKETPQTCRSQTPLEASNAGR